MTLRHLLAEGAREVCMERQTRVPMWSTDSGGIHRHTFSIESCGKLAFTQKAGIGSETVTAGRHPPVVHIGMLSRPFTQALSHCVNSSIVPLIGWVDAPPVPDAARRTLN